MLGFKKNKDSKTRTFKFSDTLLTALQELSCDLNSAEPKVIARAIVFLKTVNDLLKEGGKSVYVLDEEIVNEKFGEDGLPGDEIIFR